MKFKVNFYTLSDCKGSAIIETNDENKVLDILFEQEYGVDKKAPISISVLPQTVVVKEIPEDWIPF